MFFQAVKTSSHFIRYNLEISINLSLDKNRYILKLADILVKLRFVFGEFIFLHQNDWLHLARKSRLVSTAYFLR